MAKPPKPFKVKVVNETTTDDLKKIEEFYRKRRMVEDNPP
jgi:hypothetical protein